VGVESDDFVEVADCLVVLLETVVGAGAMEEGGVEVGFEPDEFGEVANCFVVLLERVVSGAAIEEGELLVGFEPDASVNSSIAC
jgi:hypothetical protein